MRKIVLALVAVAAVAVLVVPAVSLGAHGHKAGHHRGHAARHAAVDQCRTERSKTGVAAFRAKYKTPHAFRHCVKAHLPADRAAAKQCRAERRSTGRTAFRAKYGERHALRTCIERATAGSSTPAS